MSKKIFILRHGEASTDRKWLDIERPLTELGVEMIRKVGQRLNTSGSIDLVLSSSAKRTRETTATVLGEISQQLATKFDAGLYNASLQQVIAILGQTEAAHNSLLLIGHNPSLSELVTWLGSLSHLSMAPGQLVEMELFVEDWNELSGGCGRIVG